MTPEILTTPSGPYFIVQNLRNTFLLSALHTYSDTLSVHRMDVSLIPVFLYKIPSHCQDILICSNVLYSTQMVDVNNEQTGEVSEVADKPPPVDCKEADGKCTDNTNQEEVQDTSKRVNAVGVISSAMASIRNGEDVVRQGLRLCFLVEFILKFLAVFQRKFVVGSLQVSRRNNHKRTSNGFLSVARKAEDCER